MVIHRREAKHGEPVHQGRGDTVPVVRYKQRLQPLPDGTVWHEVGVGIRSSWICYHSAAALSGMRTEDAKAPIMVINQCSIIKDFQKRCKQINLHNKLHSDCVLYAALAHALFMPILFAHDYRHSLSHLVVNRRRFKPLIPRSECSAPCRILRIIR